MRSVLNTALFVLFTLVGATMAVSSYFWDRSGDTVLRMARVWSRLVLRTTGVKMTVRFEEPLDPSRPYVFMSNHLSSADIWSLFYAVPFPIRMISKKQLGLIPIFGWAMRVGRFIFIDRQNPVAARRSIEEAARRIKAGHSVIIFPEGTRSRDGAVGPFKKGGFHLARASGAEIVPVAILGTREIMPRGSLLMRPGSVFVGFGKPIPTQGLDEEQRRGLTERVRGQVIAMQASAQGVARDDADDKPPSPAPVRAQ
jgi:1-acyl-sn-glycerol-3-phosphate acyltransferase